LRQSQHISTDRIDGRQTAVLLCVIRFRTASASFNRQLCRRRAGGRTTA